MVNTLAQASQNALEASAGEVWKWIAVTVIPILTSALVWVTLKWIGEKVARLEEKNLIIAKLEKAEENRSRRETERRGA